MEEVIKSPCHNSGITQEGECEVCRKPVENGKPTEAPEAAVGNAEDSVGKTGGAPAPATPETPVDPVPSAPADGSAEVSQ